MLKRRRLCDFALGKLVGASDERLGVFTTKYCINALDKGDCFVGLLLWEAAAIGAIDMTQDQAVNLVGKYVEVAAQSTTFAFDQSDAIFCRHVLQVGAYDSPLSTDYLDESATLGNAFALFQSAENRWNADKKLEGTIEAYSKAMRRGHSNSAFRIIELVAQEEKLKLQTPWSKLADEAAWLLARSGASAGMLDVSIREKAKANFMLKLSAVESPQARHILSTSENSEDCTASRALEEVIYKYQAASSRLISSALCDFFESAL